MKKFAMSIIGIFVTAIAMIGLAGTANAENQHNVVRDSSTQGTVKEVEYRTFQGTVKETEFRGSQGETRSAEVGVPLGGALFEADVREGFAIEPVDHFPEGGMRQFCRSIKGTNNEALLVTNDAAAKKADDC